MVLLSTMAIAAGPLVAQAPINVAPGTRIRVSSSDRQLKDIIGVVAAHRGDSLVVRRNRRGDTLALNIREITRLQVSARRPHGWAGAGIGLVGGAVLGAVIGHAEGDDPPEPCSDIECWFVSLDHYTASEKAAAGAFFGGLIGAITGGIVGHYVQTDRWRTIIAPGPNVTTAAGVRSRTVNVEMRLAIF
jgi:hypothetical protein